jgi:hypothetical protein
VLVPTDEVEGVANAIFSGAILISIDATNKADIVF